MAHFRSELLPGFSLGVSERTPSLLISASSLARSSLSAVVTKLGLADADGDALSEGEALSGADADSEGEGESLFWGFVTSAPWLAEGVGVPCDCVTAGSIARTGRKFICEDERIRSRVSWEGVPGIDTEILLDPREEISDSDTPDASIRWRIMLIASVISLSVTSRSPCPVETGVKISCVPPCRSRAKEGV